MNIQAKSDRLLTMRQVRELVPACRQSIYAWVAKGKFPAPRKYGTRRIGFLNSEIQAWLASRELVAGPAWLLHAEDPPALRQPKPNAHPIDALVLKPTPRLAATGGGQL